MMASWGCGDSSMVFMAQSECGAEEEFLGSIGVLWLIVQNYIFEMFLLLPSIFGGALIS
jgi:hypothetical protein